MKCQQEMCPNWSGDGDVCPCAIFDLDPPALCPVCNGVTEPTPSGFQTCREYGSDHYRVAR